MTVEEFYEELFQDVVIEAESQEMLKKKLSLTL